MRKRSAWTACVVGLAVGGVLGHGRAAAETSLDERGRLEGRVLDERGAPLVGAMVSVFGPRLAGGGFIAVTDEQGRFRLPELPPGFYSLRAYLRGFLPSRFSRVEIGEESAAVPVSVTLPRLEEDAAAQDGAAVEAEAEDPSEAARRDSEERLEELKWILRHGRRNVLHQREQGGEGQEETARPRPVDLAASLDVRGELGMLAAAFEQGLDGMPGGGGLDASVAFARLEIPAGARSRWLVDAQLLESALSSWAARAELLAETAPGRSVSAGVSYGHHVYGDVRAFRPPEGAIGRTREGDRSAEWFGSVFGAHRIDLGRATIDAGLTYYHYSYLEQDGYAAPRLSVSWSPDERTAVRAAVAHRIAAPGGEDLDLLARVVSAELVAPADLTRRRLRAQRAVRYELALERELDAATAVGVRVFQEDVRHRLLKAFLRDRPFVRVGPGHYLVTNLRGDYRARGVGIDLRRRFGGVDGRVGYTFGVGRTMPAVLLGPAVGDGEIHDVLTAVETSIDRTQTRVSAMMRLIHHPALVPSEDGRGRRTFDSRFNVQVVQLLPFVGRDGTDWELMVAVRNLFYEDADGAALLDEIAVIDSPRRVLGGVSVRF